MRIYVGNLAYGAVRSDLEDLFGQYGTVTDAYIVMDRETGRSRGFAFVEMENDAEATAAIEALNETDLQGRALRINEARPRPTGGDGRY